MRRCWVSLVARDAVGSRQTPARGRRTLHLDAGVRRRAQQHELAAALQGAPGRVLDEVRALLVRQPRDHLRQCGVRLGVVQT